MAFYLNNKLITSRLEEGIQSARYSEEMHDYIRERFEWTDQQTSMINWRAVGLAKKRLTHDRSIRISKMMHNWLNVGHQKERIHGSATDALCPCCGIKHEDQDHMFQCQSESTRKAVNTGIAAMKKALQRDNVPPAISIAFINRVKQATSNDGVRETVQCPHARCAGDAQDTLGTMAILRGHHHREWFYAIQDTYQKRPSIPGDPKRRQPKDKSPLELCATLVQETWRFFELVWESRNHCLHNPEGTALEHIETNINDRLLHYKRNSKALLHYGDRHWIEFPEHTIRGWKFQRKHRVLRVLDGWHQKLTAETIAFRKNQILLLDYAGFTVTTLPPEPP